jgi:anti-anti-sigma factor
VGTQLMGETTIVTFAGEIDVATMKQFAGMLRMHLNDGAPIVLIDMAEVGFASAGSVMRVLLTAIREARTRGAVVQVLLSPAVRRVAAVLGVVGECEAEAGVSAKIGGAESAAMVAYHDSQSSTCTSSMATVRISDRTA